MAQPTSATETNNGPHLGVSTRFITSQAGKENLAFIDALRGLAALYVVICHVGFIRPPSLSQNLKHTSFMVGTLESSYFFLSAPSR
jgi:peptidoglycan/LPS O-acetylase OafA/YrhL